MTIPFYKPAAPPPGVFYNVALPEKSAGWLSRLFFHWVTPILKVGYARPLEADDLWTLTEELQCRTNAEKLEANFMKRMPPSLRPAEYRPAQSDALQHKEIEKDVERLPPPAVYIEQSAPAETGQDERLTTLLEDNLFAEQQLSRVSYFLPEDGGNRASFVEAALRHPRRSSIPSKHSDETRRMSQARRDSRVASQIYAETLQDQFDKKTAKKIAEGRLAIEDGKRYDMSLWKAIYFTIWKKWWLAVVLDGIGSGMRICAPLLTRLIIQQLTEAHDFHQAVIAGQSTADLPIPKPIGYGIGIAFAYFALQILSGIILYLEIQIATVLGCTTKAAIIDVIAKKAIRLSPKSRLEMTSGRVTQMVTADTSYLDWVLPATVELPVQPVIICVGIGILVYVMGYSALVGIAVLLFAAPSQGYMFKKLLSFRTEQEALVDKRIKLLTEAISNIRVVKLYAYETLFLDKVSAIRRQEHAMLRKFSSIWAAIWGSFELTPVAATILTFVTYSLSGHALTPSVVFTGLQFFSILNMPISSLPNILSGLMDAISGLRRITQLLKSEELPHDIQTDWHSPWAINVSGDFQFEGSANTDKATSDGKRTSISEKQSHDDDEHDKTDQRVSFSDHPEKAFSLRDLDLKIRPGALVCVVGRVGTGKSALLLSMVNEMKRLRGHISFGGKLSYGKSYAGCVQPLIAVPQQAWVQSGTVRDNITFSSSEEQVDEVKLRAVIEACCLNPDIQSWTDGQFTQVGEKGITLSGGQRQRLCIARAAYDTGDIVLLDDPLSAVDAQVGLHLLHNCILSGPLASRTRVLVTHHLDVLPFADVVLVMDRTGANEGRIVQQGSYKELASKPGAFSKLIAEFGSTLQEEKRRTDTSDAQETTQAPSSQEKSGENEKDQLILAEERETGAVGWNVYVSYLKATGSWLWPLAAGSLLLLEQGATVGTSLILGFWSNQEFSGWTNGEYMGLYAGVGASVAILAWVTGNVMMLAGIAASYRMFNTAWNAVMRSPTTWHDRTPTGRITSRLSKDIQMLDDRMATMWYQFLYSVLNILGTFGLIIYTYPYLGLAFIPILVFFWICASYYRTTSRELKRLDSTLRSHVYSTIGEMLAGRVVISAFARQRDYQERLADAIDGQNRAYILSVALQRWLAVRLVFCSQGLVLLIAIFGVAFREQVNASKFGVVISYAASTATVLNSLVPLFAKCEAEMNNVERVQHFMQLETEAAPTLPTDPLPSENWPSKGEVTFTNVCLQYRPELPMVLKQVSFKIQGGERVGIIGRTGAGKSSIAQALFRTVEICDGNILIDGKDCSKLGLDTLRTRLAIIPQDAFLFEGTVRENIDPAQAKTDNELKRILSLIYNSARASESLRQKFRLDTKVENEGANFSAGERQLLGLLRALVRNCKVLLLDEATSSLDPETDALIQTIIQTNFKDTTLISIAHRLQTVAYYDRILVLDEGQVKEYDAPLALFDQPKSTFRSLCTQKGLSRADLVKIQRDAQATAEV